jgi:N-acetylneuraminic acid mutarotase
MNSTMRRMFFFLCVNLLLPLALCAQGYGHWVTTTKFAPLPEPSEEYWSATANGKFYLFGGTAVGSGSHRTGLPRRVLEYDPATDKWTSKKQMPYAADHMTVAEYRGKIYLFGGAGAEKADSVGPGNVQLNDTWEYDPASDSWKQLAPMPTRRSAGAAVAAGDKIYVIGGSGLAPGASNPPTAENMLVLGTNEVFDPATGKWETKRVMPTPRNHPAIGTVNGKIYVIGGRTGGANVANLISSPTDVVEEYDPATDRWRAMTKMPTARSGHGWATYQNRIYVAGGEVRDHHMDAIFRDVEAFDPVANEWFQLPSMQTARHGVNAAVLGNQLHLIGGHIAFDGAAEHDADTGVHEVFEISGK